jgi:hypothetical protein
MAREASEMNHIEAVAAIMEALDSLLVDAGLGKAGLLADDWNICRRAYEVVVGIRGHEFMLTIPESVMEGDGPQSENAALHCALGQAIGENYRYIVPAGRTNRCR